MTDDDLDEWFEREESRRSNTARAFEHYRAAKNGLKNAEWQVGLARDAVAAARVELAKALELEATMQEAEKKGETP